MTQNSPPNYVELTAELVSAYVSHNALPAGLFNALSERGGAGGAVKDVFPLFERSPV